MAKYDHGDGCACGLYKKCVEGSFFESVLRHGLQERKLRPLLALTEELILSGADIVKVGIGPGSVCTTRI